MSETKIEPYTGGCLCGAVRYEGREFQGAAYCHCRMCQQAAGGPFYAFAQFARDSFRITGEPKWYRSSEIMDRGFCAACGTPLFVKYRIAKWSDWLIASIGSLDHPEAVPPQRHYGSESMIPWLEIADGLPRESYAERFIEKLLADDRANPDQGSAGFRVDALED